MGRRQVCERVLNSTDKLAEFPGCTRPRQSTARACAGSVWPAACDFYEVDDQEQIVRVLAVVGQRQNPRRIKGEP